MSIFAGAFSDRWPKKVTMLASDTFAAACTVGVLLLMTTGRLEIWHLYVLNALNGLMNTIQQPAADVTISLLTPPRHYQKVSGLRSLSNSLTGILTPVLATALLDVYKRQILLHLTRGSGLRGLCGIAPVRDAVIRPLLDCTRAEVEDYCRANGIPFITDSTNADQRYSRNRIRHAVVPILSELNPRGAQAAGRTARLLREDADYLDGLARQAERQVRRADGAYDAAALRGLPPALRGRVLRRLAGTSEGEDPLHDLDAETIGRLERLLDSERGGINLPGGRTVLLAAGQLTIRVSPVDLSLIHI